MPKRSDLPSSKKSLPIYDEDWEFLFDRYGPGGLQAIGVGPVIREIVHRKVKEIRAKEQDRLDEAAEGVADATRFAAK